MHRNATTWETFCYPPKGWQYSWSSISPSGCSCGETRVQWEPCAHPGRLIAGLLMTAKHWKQLLFISRRMDAKYLADFFFCWGSVDSLTLCKLKVYSVLTWGFPVGPVVKTPLLHCLGHEFHPWLGNWDMPQAAQCSQKKRKKKENTDLIHLYISAWLPLKY